MRVVREALSPGLALGLALSAGIAAAQPVPPRPAVGGDSRAFNEQVFIAPSGEVFHAPRSMAYPSAAWFAQADRNHDGRLSQSEMTADFGQFFDKLDVDHDGVLRQDEIKRYESEIAPEVASYGAAPRRTYYTESSGGGGGGGDNDSSSAVGRSTEIESDLKFQAPTGGGRFGLINIPEPVASMDTDFNGMVTRQEMQAAARRRFALLDPAGRGSLAVTDLPQTFAQRSPRRQRR